MGHVLGNGGFSKHVETPEDALVGEMQSTVAVATILFDNFVLQAFLGDMALFVTVVAEVVAASASKDWMLYWTSAMGSQWHPIFGWCHHWSICNMHVTQLFEDLHLLHPSLDSVHLHIHRKQGA